MCLFIYFYPSLSVVMIPSSVCMCVSVIRCTCFFLTCEPGWTDPTPLSRAPSWGCSNSPPMPSPPRLLSQPHTLLTSWGEKKKERKKYISLLQIRSYSGQRRKHPTAFRTHHFESQYWSKTLTKIVFKSQHQQKHTILLSFILSLKLLWWFPIMHPDFFDSQTTSQIQFC